MKSKTVLIVLGVGAVGAAAWWYMKNKQAADAPPPTVIDKIMAKNPDILLASPLANNFTIKEPSPNTLPHAIADLKMNSGNTGIVPPLLTITTVKPVAIPAIAPAPTVPKPTAAVANGNTQETLSLKLKRMGLLGIGDAYSLN